MTQQDDPARFFGEAQAATYDTNFAKLAPLKDALHLCMRGMLAPLPHNARILCVGAGTGAELLYLAEAFPGWHFVLVEPSGPMLQRCHQRATQANIAPRCVFHQGYLDSLPSMEPCHAATAILVSQFLLEQTARSTFFKAIAERLTPGGSLITADLAGNLHADQPGGLTAGWMELMRYNTMSDGSTATYRAALEANVAVCEPHIVESILRNSGFDDPVCFCKTMLIHAWFARRTM